MKALLSKQLILISLLVLPSCFIKAQAENTPTESKQKHLAKEIVSHSSKISQELNLISTNKKIEHVFHITMSKKDFKKLSKTENIEKNCLSNCIMTHNNDSLSVNEIELRGKGSMEYIRKSLSIKLDTKIAVTKDGVIHKFKKFNLISLSMDKNYFRNKVAFDLMSQLGLFNLFYTYAEVIINDQTQGIYLMVQKPKNYAFKKEDANFMLRRDYQNKIKKVYSKGSDSTMTLRYEESFNKIYNETVLKEGQEFYEELSEVLDVKQYFTWMSFNYLVGNKDYTDEVFFFNKAKGDSIKFGIIPWDYDDIFWGHPHEGNLVRLLSFGDKLAFSSEDVLDFKLVVDDYTYAKYLQTLSDVIEKISESVIKDVFELTYQEVYPYYSKKDILKVTKADKYGKTDLDNLETDMHYIYNWLLQKRDSTAKALTPIITEITPSSGYVGTTVIIYGTNFSSEISKNSVYFNGIQAKVLAAKANILITKVPEGATAGKVVALKNSLKSSGYAFDVNEVVEPTITSVYPISGDVGDEITITGTNFSYTSSDNKVSFGGRTAKVIESTDTTITVYVPATTSASNITVSLDGETSNSVLFTYTGVPVNILTIHIITDADDAEEGSNNGRLTINSSDLEFGEYDTRELDGVEQGLQTIGIKFDSITIPATATVLEAYIQFTADNIGDTTVQLTIYGEDNSNPAAYNEAIFYNITSRTKTTSGAVWNIPKWVRGGDAEDAQKTVDLSNIVREILDRADWASGNSIAFIIEPSGPSIGYNKSFKGREAKAGPGEESAALTIIWTD